MNREIKFRAWVNNPCFYLREDWEPEEHMIQVTTINIKTGNIRGNWDLKPHEVSKYKKYLESCRAIKFKSHGDFTQYKLMQYTDSYDVKDIRLCEGDIFFIGDNKNILYKIIKYKNGFYYNELGINDFRWTFPLPHNTDIIKTPMTLVGNIYQYKELLQ